MERTIKSKATQRKAVTFVLNAAKYMKLPVEMNTSKGVDPGPSGLPESASEAAEPTSTKKSLAVYLVSGGTIEISVDVDLLRLDKADREFLFDLIDKVRAYHDHRQREKKRDVESNDDLELIRRGDQEVPF